MTKDVEVADTSGGPVCVWRLTALVVGHFLLCLFARQFEHLPGDIAGLRPATGFAVALLWRLSPSCLLPGLLGVFVTASAVEVVGGLPLALALAHGALAGAVVASGLLVLDAMWPQDRGHTPQSVFLAILAVGVVVPLAGVALGVLAIDGLFGRSPDGHWNRWLTGEMAGAALVLPIVVSLRRSELRALFVGRAALEMAQVAVATAVALVGTVAWIGRPNVLLIVPMVWAAFRLGPLAVALLGAGLVATVQIAFLAGWIGLAVGAPPGFGLGPWSILGVLLPYGMALLLADQRRERDRLAVSERYFRDAMHHSPFGMALLDVTGRCFAANRALGDMLGYAPEELIGRTPADITAGDDRSEVLPRIARLVSGEIDEYALEKQFRRKDGTPVWVFIAVSVMRDEETGEPLHLIAQMKDIEVRRRAEMALEKSESRWNFALESAGQGVWDYDYRSRETFYSPVWSRMLGYEPGELSGESDAWLALVHPYDLPRLLRHEQQHLAGETEQFECEFRMRHKDGRWLWILDRGKVIERDAEGRPVRMIGTHTDITEHRRLTEALQEEKERLRITLHSIGDGVVCTDAEGRVTFMNPIAETLTGWTAASALGRLCDTVFEVVQEGTDQPAVSAVTACLAGLERVSHDEGLVLVGRHGARIDVEASASPVRKASGELIGTVLVFQDVTRARTLQKELAQLATHDALTGLQNRSAFEHALAEHCGRAVSDGSGHALCFVDLDRFKIINDTAGHAAGDALLREIGRLIRDHMRRHDLVARLGGDEFGILLTHCSIVDAQRIADRLLERIGRVRFSWDGRVYEIGASIGIARLDADTPLAADVMSRADVACYAAKAAGRNRVSVYHPSEGDARRHHTELHTAAGIRAALDADRFVVYAQEIRDLRPAGHLQRHAELLVRMRDEDGSLKPPGAFIPAAERYGLMAAIDRWMIRRVLHVYDRAVLAVPRLSVSINLSANSLEDPTLVDFLAAELQRSALPPHRLRFEITETSLINNITHAGRLVEDLRAAGYAIMLDDFGAGVSSFAYLEHFPADYIKIDGGFVRKLKTHSVDRAIVESINDIGHKLGAVTVAEFVEDEETVGLLAEIGVDMAQGYHIARPEPIETLLARLAAETAPAVGTATGT